MNKVWTRKMLKVLKAEYKTADLDELATRLGVTKNAVKSKARVVGLTRRMANWRWTEYENKLFLSLYAETPNPELAQIFNRSLRSIENHSVVLGLRKSPEFLSANGKRLSKHPKAIACQFKKGHEPQNKGKHIEDFMSAEGIKASSKTRFKLGHVPHNIKPIGYESVRHDGYVYIKTEEGMVPKHTHLWRKYHGEVPAGMCVSFRDGNRQNCEIENLILISESEKATRVTAAMTPEQKRERNAKANAKRNETIRRDKIRIHWGFEPKSKLVKRW